MKRAVGVFGIPDKSFISLVKGWQEEVLKLGYPKNEGYLDTLPHLTLVVNHNFTGSDSEVKSKVEPLLQSLKGLVLPVKEAVVIDKNVALKFDNTPSLKLATKLESELFELGFSAVPTDFMKVIRWLVKDQDLATVKELVLKNLPQQIQIERLALVGGDIRHQDIIWSVGL